MVLILTTTDSTPVHVQYSWHCTHNTKYGFHTHFQRQYLCTWSQYIVLTHQVCYWYSQPETQTVYLYWWHCTLTTKYGFYTYFQRQYLCIWSQYIVLLHQVWYWYSQPETLTVYLYWLHCTCTTKYKVGISYSVPETKPLEPLRKPQSTVVTTALNLKPVCR